MTQLDLADDQTQRRLAREKAPSTRLQTESSKFFHKQISGLGSPYDLTSIPISVLKQMERDPMIAFGLHFIRTPILRAKWRINCNDARVAAFVDHSLRKVRASLFLQSSGSFNYGFKPIVKRYEYINPDWTYFDREKSDEPLKVWDNGNVDAITWKPFIPLPSDPALVEPIWNQSGEFNGMHYAANISSPIFPFQPGDADGKIKVPVSHSLWFVNERHTVNGSIWGYPRVGYAYRFWWSYWFRWAIYDRFFERKADPPYIVYFPTGSDEGDFSVDEAGTRKSMREIALGVGENAKSSGVVALPGDTVTGYDDRPTQLREWEVKELQLQSTMDGFLDSFEYLDVMKLRALWIPEQALITGTNSQSSRNVAKEELSIMRESQESIADEFDDQINRFMIPDLVEANFPEFKGECTVETTGFARADEQMVQTIIQLIGQSDVGALQEIDLREVLERANMPLVSQEEILRQEKIAIEEAQKIVPEPFAPANGQVGVTEQGLYVNDRPVIRLSETEDFIASLPSTDHYKDRDIVTTAKEIREDWKGAYKDFYEGFAKHLESQKDLKFAENDELIDQILDGWEFPREQAEELIRKTQDNIGKVINRGALLAIRNFDLNQEWSPERESVAKYLEDSGAELVSSINDTTREELRTTLSSLIREGKTVEELANEIRIHFAQFPGWKANRIARSEIRSAYNFAVLDASDAAGLAQVRAKDAQLGESDAECEARNNQVFDIPEAIAQTRKEHPNGTLEWVPLPTENFSIEYVEGVEEGGTLAWYEESTQTVKLANDIPSDIENEYLSALLDKLQCKS